MHGGYLIVETNDAHPGLVRLYTAEGLPTLPSTPGVAPIPRHAAYFDDLSAARMHAHEILRRRAADAASGFYRISPIEAISAIESIGLRHRRVFLDPMLAGDANLQAGISKHRARRMRWDRAWHIVGFAAVLFLIAKLIFGY